MIHHRRFRNFRSFAVIDFEYEISDGDLPNVLCLVAYIFDDNFKHVRTIRMWRGEFGAAPPFDIGPDTLIIGYSLWAEMSCFITLGWKFPVHVFDLHTAYLSISNILLPYDDDENRKKPRKKLQDACRAYDIEGWENIDKGDMAKDIGNGLWRKYGKPAVLTYCQEDVAKSSELFRRQVTGYCDRAPADVEFVLAWSEYSAKAVSRIQARGTPIDMPLWNLVQENKAAVIRALILRFDPSYADVAPEHIYTIDGEWSDARFEKWLAHAGVIAWPRLASGKIQIDSDAFRMMYPAHPALAGLHALRDAIGVVVRARIPIGHDSRNRPSIFPFGCATGRNAHAKSLFNAHASMRSFMLFPEDSIGVYFDWRTQEIAVAAAYSGDQQLIEDYSGGDVYHALAIMCGLTNDTDTKRWKNDHKGQRQQMKAIQLGINYGMGVRSLARGLDRHPLIAAEVIRRHKNRHPQYWAWRAERVQRAMFERKIEADFDGWPMHLSTSPNKRTLYNFPMQSGGASMLRLAAVRLCEAGLVPSMLVHDGILLELQNPEQVEQARAIMEAAGTEVCKGLVVDVETEFDTRKHGSRFIDKRPIAIEMWRTVMDVLIEIGALKAGTV
jgi:DNA polymerase I